MSDNICMLAHTWDERKVNPTGWWMAEKLDGVRAMWNGLHLRTRNGHIIHAPQYWTETLPKDKNLDGELFMGRGLFQKTVSIVRTHVPDDKEWLKVGYMVFDVVGSQPWIDRFRVDCAAPVVPVMHYECKGIDNLMEYYNSVVDNGGEGIMLRNPNSPYEAKRSWNLLKVKPEMTMIAEVIGHTEGEGKYVGMVGALECKAGDTIFNVGSGLTDADRTHKYAPKIGSSIKIAYQCLTDSGKPRFPRLVERV